MKLGLVGLPNAGKTTLFNALTQAGAKVAPYPFTTIDPNVGYAILKDERLDKIGQIVESEKILYPSIRVVDIAGLVEGAHKGEGLGNQFLSHIRGMDALILVLDAFSDNANPERDFSILWLELALSDMELLQRRRDKLAKEMKGKRERETEVKYEIIEKAIDYLGNGDSLKDKMSEEEINIIDGYELLTLKAYIVVFNIKPEDIVYGADGGVIGGSINEKVKSSIVMSCLIEEEMTGLNNDEGEELMKLYSMKETEIDKLINLGLKALNLIVFYTTEGGIIQGWTIKEGSKAREAASIIHTDMAKGFIKAEVVNYNELVRIGDLKKVKEVGKMRIEGADYTLEDGDLLKFIFKVKS